jgi:hypothetical protein
MVFQAIEFSFFTFFAIVATWWWCFRALHSDSRAAQPIRADFAGSQTACIFLWYSQSLALAQVERWEFVPS